MRVSVRGGSWAKVDVFANAYFSKIGTYGDRGWPVT